MSCDVLKIMQRRVVGWGWFYRVVGFVFLVPLEIFLLSEKITEDFDLCYVFGLRILN